MFSLFEDQTQTMKKSVVMVGRFQPPTAGHYYVIDKMKEYLADNKHGVTGMAIVIVDGAETGRDKSTNPLTYDERRSFLKASGRANGVTILRANDAMNAFKEARSAGFEPVTVAAGSDRAAKYVELLDKYFNKDIDGNVITHQSLPGLIREPSEDAPEGFIDVAKISGTMARHAASHGFLEEFTEIVGLNHKPKLAKILFDKVSSRIPKE